MVAVVLDGNQRSSLAIIRSLAAKGIATVVGCEADKCLSSASIYKQLAFTYAAPQKNPEEFLKTVTRKVAEFKNSVVLPVTDVTLGEVLANRQMFPAESCLPFADYQCYARLSNKAELIDIAREKQIAIPRTCVFSSADSPSQIEEEARCIGFPVVIKPALSRVRTVHGWLSTRVHYARDANELRLVLDSDPSCGYPLLLQERVYGPGVGIFLLMNHGEVIARFAHKRIREKPPSGGVSVLCESIRPPSDALSAAEKLLRHLNWYGIAMVEFKRDGREGRAKLMEVNARFWGSLQLAISAGVDFPYLLYRMAAGEKVIPVLKYREGQKVRWELGDLDHLLMRMLKNPKQILLPKGAPNKKQVLKDFIKDFFDERVENEIFSIHDPGPFLFEVKNYLKDITGSARLCLRRSKACCSF